VSGGAHDPHAASADTCAQFLYAQILKTHRFKLANPFAAGSKAESPTQDETVHVRAKVIECVRPQVAEA
jgi:hypothetical protein